MIRAETVDRIATIQWPAIQELRTVLPRIGYTSTQVCDLFFLVIANILDGNCRQTSFFC